MRVVRTVLGDLRPEELGVCYAHEHIIIERSYTTGKWPDFLINDIEKSAAELRDFHRAGGRAMVDSMPCDSGRNAEKLAEVSRRSGVHILCPTGLHLAKFYPEGHWAERISVEELTHLFVDDIQLGIDRNDYGGPRVDRTGYRAGLIKVAGGKDSLNDHERKVFEAAAICHRETGAPILTHTEQGTAAVEQVEYLGSFGVAPNRVILSHTDRIPDLGYHREILSTGAFVEYDSAFRSPSGEGNPTLELVVSLFEDGFGGRIMLGMDAARRHYWRQYGGGPGLTYLLDCFWPLLRERGLSADDFETIFRRNPADAFSFPSDENNPGASEKGSNNNFDSDDCHD